MAGVGLAITLGLLAGSFNGCSWHREYVRRGVLLDSLASRTNRVETGQQTQATFLQELRADMLTDLEATRASTDQLQARIIDLDERIARIGRKLGVWYEADVSASATGSDTVSGTPQPADTTRTGIDPDQLYNTAYLDFTRGKYKIAIAGFGQFIQMFPNSEMADNAQYWKAECYYSLNELAKAEEEFRLVLTGYPDGNKVPAASYKLGLVYLTENRRQDAQRQLQEVVAKYPGTTEAKLAQDRLDALE